MSVVLGTKTVRKFSPTFMGEQVMGIQYLIYVQNLLTQDREIIRRVSQILGLNIVRHGIEWIGIGAKEVRD